MINMLFLGLIVIVVGIAVVAAVTVGGGILIARYLRNRKEMAQGGGK